MSGESISLQAAVIEHGRLVSKHPVAAEDLMRSLGHVDNAGRHELETDEARSTVRFANSVAPLYAGALALNEQGLVQPPLNNEQLQGIMDKQNELSLLTQGNGETGDPEGPTDPSTLDTTGRK